MADGPHVENIPAGGPDTSVIDLAFRASHLDELEHYIKTFVPLNKLVLKVPDGGVNGEIQFHGWSDLAVFDVRYGCQLSIDLDPDPADDRIAFTMAKGGSGQLLLGREELLLSASQGTVFTSGNRQIVRYNEDSEILSLVLNRRKMAEYCAKLLGHDIERPIDFDARFALDTIAGQSWVRLFQYAVTELNHPQSLVRYMPAARQHLEQTVMTGFLLAHSHTYSSALLKPQQAAAPYYVKRAEAYIEVNFDKPLSLAEIAAEAGVSARSLQTGFQSFRNTTPMAFLRSVRLQRAHRALLKADPAVATVTDIALSCGFTHLGEFAAMYRRAFGVTPKETLSKISYR